MHFVGWVARDGSLIFFFADGVMSGGEGDGLVGVKDNLSDSSLFRSISKVCLFFYLKNPSKKDINY